jgi:cell division GTPase FtsZ
MSADVKEVNEDEVMPTEETLQNRPRREILKTDLERDVRLKVFVIGVGNAGNQTIAYGHKEGMNVYAINSSMRDLSDVIMDETIPSFIVGTEARGSGKNIDKGIKLFKENGRELFKEKTFMDSCQDADVIVVVSATGGGTGPSVSPEICRILKKIIIYHGITPKNSDSNIAFSNSTYCLNEIKKLEIPYMLTDLERFKDDPNDVAFIKADKHAIECIKAISGLFLTMSSSQMIDENDLKSIISEPGYMGVYSVNGITSAGLEKKTMQAMLIDEIKRGPAVMIQKDGISMQMGSIVNCPDDMTDVTRTGNYQELCDFIGHRPKNGIYENYGITNGTTGQFVVIISGMTYPINRLQEYTNAIKEQNEFLKKQKEIDTSEDADLVRSLVSNNDDKLSSESKADESKVNSVLDDFFG